jgi:hypothetical protein
VYKKNSRTQKSLFKEGFFTTTKLAITELPWLAYIYHQKMPIASTIATSKIHSKVTTACKKYIRQLLAENGNIEEVQIGCPNIFIEIDETKLDKRKNNRDHKSRCVWVVAEVKNDS